MTIRDNKSKNPFQQAIYGNDFITKFVENQRTELAIKAQNIEIEKKKNEFEFEYAKLALEKQFELTKHVMEHQRKSQKGVYGMVVFSTLLVTAVVVYAMKTDHIDVAMRILEIIATSVISGFGGYHAGKSKKEKPSSSNQSQPSTKNPPNLVQ